MINILLVDDEQHALESLDFFIRETGGTTYMVHMAQSVEEANQLVKQVEPDIVFLDMNLDGQSGLELLSGLDDITFQVIFATAHPDYALKAFKVDAVDYLLKPFTFEDTKKALEKAVQRIDRQNISKSPVEIKNKKLMIPTPSGYQFLSLDKLLFCASSRNYSILHLDDAQKIMVSWHLGALEEQLPGSLFFRCHKSYLVNLFFVSAFNRDLHKIVLKDGSLIPLSKRKSAAFFRHMR